MPECAFAGQPRQSAAQRFVRQVTLSETRGIGQARVEETAGGPYPTTQPAGGGDAGGAFVVVAECLGDAGGRGLEDDGRDTGGFAHSTVVNSP